MSEELVRVAILWHEKWHEGLEEASRLYFGDGDVEAMLLSSPARGARRGTHHSTSVVQAASGET